MSTGEVHDDAISLVQERMWLADRIAPRGSVNSVAAIVPLVGPLDADLLRRSVDEVVRRHEVLRTSYPAERGKPRRRVLERLALDLPVVDLSALPPTIRRSETIRLAGEVAREPFDLPRGPLVRGRLFRLTPTEHVLVFALHYIVADSGSLGIFIREVATLYDAFSGGRPSPLPELVTQYAEVARHEREAFERGALEREIAWWRERLDGAPDVLALPSDRPRKDVATLRSGQVLFYVPPELTARVRAFARRERTTPFLVFLTAFEALLARFAGTREIVVGTPVANRVGHDVTRLIGMFANTLVLRTDLGAAQSLRDALGAVQRTVLEANRHRELPFELLAESLLRGRPRVRAHAPIFQIVVNYMDPSIDSGRFGDVEVRELEASGGDAQAIPAMWWRSASENHSFYDLFLTLSPVGERTDCAIEYATDLFEPASIDALVASFRDAIELLVAEPDAALSSVTLAPRLVSLAEASKARARPYRIAIAATFTAEPVDDVIAFWGKELGLTLGVEHAGFGQVFQELVSPDGTFRNNKYGLNVIFVRFEDWGSESPAVARDLAGALRTSAAAAKVPHLVCVTAPTSGNEAASEAATEILVRELDGSAVRIVTSAEIDALYPVGDRHDRHADALGSVPYSEAYFAALGSAVVRLALAHDRRPFKVIVVDADNTLWKGVAGEDGPDAVVVTPGRAALQRALVAEAARGTLICVVSKNEPADVEAVFAREDVMILRPSHLSASRVGWSPKPESLRALAAELDLALDAFVFVDDDPVECAAMLASCPEVLTLGLPPEDDETARALLHLWALDRWSVTREDADRARHYRAQSAREALRASLDLEEFVRRLELSVTIERASPDVAARAAQLTARTTQLNAHPVVWSPGDILARLDRPEEVWLTAAAGDRFGDYGVVGLAHGRASEEALEVDVFLLSCRALGRGIEQAMVTRLARDAEARGLSRVDVRFTPTPRNAPAARFLEAIGPAERLGPSSFVHRFPVEVIAGLAPWHRRAGEGARAVVQLEPTTASQAAATEIAPARALPFERIARELSSAYAIADAIARSKRRERPQVRAFVAPRTPLEAALAELFTRVLGVTSIGVNDNFFELGGDSLTATVLLARVEEAFAAELSLATLLDRPTLGDLARAVEAYQLDRADADALGAALDEIDQLTDEEVRALIAREAAAPRPERDG